MILKTCDSFKHDESEAEKLLQELSPGLLTTVIAKSLKGEQILKGTLKVLVPDDI